MRDAKHDQEVYFSRYSDGRVHYINSREGFSIGTEAEEAIIDHIRRFPSICPNSNVVMMSLFLGNGTGYEWTKKGTLGGLKSTEPYDTNRQFAAQVWAHTSCEFASVPYLVTWANAFCIPENITDEWLAIVMHFYNYILSLDQKEYSFQLKAYLHRSYGSFSVARKNPSIAIEHARRMKEFKEVRTAMTAAPWTRLSNR